MDLLKTKPVRGQPRNEELDKIVRDRIVKVHMSPATWKSVAKWMMSHVERFEKQFGKIPEAEGTPSKTEQSQSHIV
jgi:hypothetical protein